MGSTQSSRVYEQPPIPPLDYTLDLDDPNFSFVNENKDPEGYNMCRSIALKAATSSSLITLGILGTIGTLLRKRAKTAKMKAVTYTPGLVFVATGCALAVFSLTAEHTMHDCQFKRGIYLMDYYKKHYALGELNEPESKQVIPEL